MEHVENELQMGAFLYRECVAVDGLPAAMTGLSPSGTGYRQAGSAPPAGTRRQSWQAPNHLLRRFRWELQESVCRSREVELLFTSQKTRINK